ncbi:TraR/DksA family transcriptional regulator [Desulforapulum autotrophicum]|nr:TraR/DksA C4-type zinc finger protein [Desulforapulum autotrophicum]
MMENQQRLKLKENIKEKLKPIKKTIESYELLIKPVSPDNAIGRLTRMEAINSKSMNEAALKRARITLSKLERALARIGSPDFGLCSACEEPIPFARLMILPETELCVKCAGNMGS